MWKIKKSYLIGFLLALFLNIEGIIAYILNVNWSSGYLNQFYASTLLSLFGIVLSLYVFNKFKKKKFFISKLFYSTLALSMLVLITSGLNYFELNKVFRDLFYIWIIYSFFQLDQWRAFGQRYFNDSFIKSFALFFLLIFPLLNFIYLNHLPDRFSGWVLSKPQFANMVLLAGLIVLHSNLKSLYKHILGIISIILIIASGTRTSLLMFILYYLYYLLFYDFNENDSIVKWRVPILVVITLIFGLTFSSYIIDLINNANSFRVFSYEDIEGGSIHSRITWYTIVIQDLYQNNILGGFGAGASERLLGLLTHFDFLRYWYDYTILFPVIFIINIVYIYNRSINYRYNQSIIVDRLMFILLVFSLMAHNIFQSFPMIFLFMIYMSTFKKVNK